MKRLKIMKAYAVLWLFIYFLVYSNLETMETFFFATLTFNIAVLTVLVIGIIVIMSASIRLVMLAGTFGTLAYKKENLSFYLQGIDKIMPANIAHMFHSRAEKGVLLFTSDESRAVIEWIDEKFSNQSRYVNFFIGTALMIGLLGTFSGLLISIDQMGTIILSLSGDIDLGEVIRGFSGPLSGMATGFGSSLFGVIAAIILGLMGYILNKNQEALIEGVEDWLKGRIIDTGGASSASVSAEGSSGGEQLPEHRNSFMDVFIDNISALTKEMAKIAQTNERLHSITIASVQQARDEHESSYDMLENINKNLETINSSTKENTITIDEKLSILATELKETLSSSESKIEDQTSTIATLLTTMDENIKTQIETLQLIKTTQEKSISQTETYTHQQIEQSQARLETLQNELQQIASILDQSKNEESANLTQLSGNIINLSQTIQSDLSNIDSDLKTQIETLSTIKSTQEKSVSQTESLAIEQTQNSQARLQTLQNELREISTLLNQGKDEESQNLDQISKNIVNLSEELQNEIRLTKSIEDLHKTQISNAKEHSAMVKSENDEMKVILDKQRELLDLLVGKNDENVNELKRISSLSSGSASHPREQKSFLSKFLK